MGTSGNHGARTMSKHVKVLLPCSFHNKQRIPDELTRQLNGHGGRDSGAGGTAMVVSPFGKIWHVEVGRDGEGSFLGRGWPEFAGAHGIGVGWFLVLRHEGGSLLTVKAFDTSCCLKKNVANLYYIATTRGSTGGARRPQFIKVLLRSCMEKMCIPAEFLKHYISEEQLNGQTALVFSPLAKFWRVELKKGRSDVFFAGGWSQFTAFHGITEGDALLVRYEGNMVFTVKAFGLNGCQKEFRDQDIELHQAERSRDQDIELHQAEQSRDQDIELHQAEQTFKGPKSQQEAPSSSRKRKSTDETSSAGEKKRRKICVSVYEIGPPSWIKKEINTYALERHLPLAPTFCSAIGFREPCTITLKTSMSSRRSWQVRGLTYNNHDHLLAKGWKTFCQENKLKEGDVCTFHVVRTAL